MQEPETIEEAYLAEHWIEAEEMPSQKATSFPARNVARIRKGDYGGTHIRTYRGDEFEIETDYEFFKRILQTMRQVQIFMPPVTDEEESEEESG